MRALALSALCLAVMTGCGSSPKMRAADAQTVVVRDFSFSPVTLTVPVGTTVIWRFEGPTPHSATSDPGSAQQWNSGVLGAGATYSRTFNAAGSFPYHCDPHPFMKGTIVVR